MSETSTAGRTPDDTVSRRELLLSAGAAGAVVVVGHAAAQERLDPPRPRKAPEPGHGGLLYPQQNRHRNVFDLSGLTSS